MTVFDTVRELWASLSEDAVGPRGRYSRRLPIAGESAVYACLDRPGDVRVLAFETELPLLQTNPIREDAEGFAITTVEEPEGRRGRAAVYVAEKSPAYEKLFGLLCSDILNCWIAEPSAAGAVEGLRKRIAAWKRFMKKVGPDGLSREAYIGLYGEVRFLSLALLHGLEPNCVVSSWVAPLKANQDFCFGEVAIEIKTVTVNDASYVQIANERQLDPCGLRALFLVRFAMDFRKNAGEALAELIYGVRRRLSGHTCSRLFDERLQEAGYVDGVCNEWSTWGFTAREDTAFVCDDNFPRLLEAGLPLGVSDVSYTINLSGAGIQRVSLAALLSSLSETLA